MKYISMSVCILSLFFANVAFADASFNGLSVGLTFGVNPDYYSANANVWADNAPFTSTNESTYALAEAKGTSNGMPVKNYDGSNGLMGWNIGLAARFGFMDNMFTRIGLNYSHTLSGNEVEATYDFSAMGMEDGKATTTISAQTFAIPISFGAGVAVGKGKVYAGIGPSLLFGKMTRTAEINDSIANALSAAGMPVGNDRIAEMEYASGMSMGFHWIVGAEVEVAPKISLGFDIMTTWGGKVITEKFSAGPDTAVDAGFGSYISNAQANNGSDYALTQTLNMSGTRVNLAVMYQM